MYLKSHSQLSGICGEGEERTILFLIKEATGELSADAIEIKSTEVNNNKAAIFFFPVIKPLLLLSKLNN